MNERDMEELLKELLEECDNEKFIDDISTYKDWAFDDVNIDIEKVV